MPRKTEQTREAEKTATIYTRDLPAEELDVPKNIIARTLRSRIQRGVYTGRVPSLVQIQEMTEPKAAKNTIRAALDILRDEGLIRTVQGLGTVVIPPESAGKKSEGK